MVDAASPISSLDPRDGGANEMQHGSVPRLSPKVSRAISALRLPLMLGPVAVHACLVPESSVPQFLAARVIGDIAVPTFFFISGLLYFAGCSGTRREYFRKLGVRVFSLVIPYLLWNLIAYLVFAHWVHIVAKCDIWRSFWAVCVARRAVASAPADGPLYFIKGIAGMAIVAPAILFGLRRKALAWLPLAAAAFWVISPIPSLRYSMVVLAAAMFSLGGFAAVRGGAAFERFLESRKLCILAFAAFIGISVANVCTHLAGMDFTAVRRLNIVLGIPCAFALAARAGEKTARFLEKWQGFAMFLFCSFDVIMVFMRARWRCFRMSADETCLLVGLIVVAISAALYIALSFAAPRLLALLTGNRTRRRWREPAAAHASSI